VKRLKINSGVKSVPKPQELDFDLANLNVPTGSSYGEYLRNNSSPKTIGKVEYWLRSCSNKLC
jgi:hypothetical protein